MPGFSDTTENLILDAVFRGVTYTSPSGVWVQLHTGDPGESGTLLLATEATAPNSPNTAPNRKAATFGAASAGSVTTTSILSWTNIAAASPTETITHVSFWDAASGGTCLGTGTLTASAVLVDGDDLDLTSITFSLD